MLFRVFRILVTAAAVSCVGLTSALAAEEVFLLIPTISGESTKPGHVSWIDGLALSHSATRPAGGGASFSEVAVLKATDRSTPLLHDALVKGTNLGLVTIEVCGTPISGPSRCYYKLELSNARLTDVGLSGAASCTAADTCAPAQTESLAFSYTKIKWFYTDPGGGVTSRCWDLQMGTSC